MRHFILFCLLASTAFGQSIVTSGGNRSIVTSSRFNTVAVDPPKKVDTSEVDRLRLENEELKKSLSEKKTPVPQPQKVTVQQSRQNWYLVSESWCRNCPAAKKRFLAKGWPASHVITIAQCQQMFGFRPPHVPYEFGDPNWKSSTPVISQPVQRQQITRSRLPVVDTQWGRIDLETYSRNCNCSMCQGIRALQRQYRAGQYQTMSYEPEYKEELPPGQQPTPDAVVTEMISLMQLRPDDVLADLGCGHDARILIEAVRQTGCRGIGVEIDPVAAEASRRSVADAGLSGSIKILQGDALEFDLERHFSAEVQDGWQVTAVTAYLYEDLLRQLAPKLQQARVSASPFHQAFAGQVRHGDVWIWRR